MSNDCCNQALQDLEEMRSFAKQPDGTYKITGEMIIGDVVGAFPQAAPIMLSYGLHCVGCHANAFDTVESGATGHGMTETEIAQMVSEINTLINKKIDSVEFTKKAIAKVRELRLQEEGKENWPLRITVAEGGCAGLTYEMDFDQKKDLDNEFTFDDLHVLIDNDSLPLIKGSVIDFVDSLRGSGFKIDNPNAMHKCSCGKSFN